MTTPSEKMTRNPAMAFLEAVYPGNAELVASVFNEEATLKDATALINELRVELEKVRAEVKTLGGRLERQTKAFYETAEAWKGDVLRAEKAEAGLARWKPLIEAVMETDIAQYHDDDTDCPIIRQALAYKEQSK